jgi:hypothetical protein
MRWRFVLRMVLVWVFALQIKPVCLANTGSDWGLSINPEWANKYVSEGRNNLDSGGLFSIDLSTSWKQFTFGGWFANGDTESYQEVEIYLEYAYAFYSVESYLKFSHFEFPKDNDKDNELAVGFELAQWESITPAVDYTWSSEATGGFLELTLSSVIEYEAYGIDYIPYITQAFDFGYATTDYNGPNNLQIGLQAIMPLSTNTYLTFNVNHSWGQGDVKRDDMDDVTWFGIGLVVDM